MQWEFVGLCLHGCLGVLVDLQTVELAADALKDAAASCSVVWTGCTRPGVMSRCVLLLCLCHRALRNQGRTFGSAAVSQAMYLNLEKLGSQVSNICGQPDVIWSEECFLQIHYPSVWDHASTIACSRSIQSNRPQSGHWSCPPDCDASCPCCFCRCSTGGICL